MTGSWVFLAAIAPVVTFIEGGWRYMGGASIVFHGIKTYVFGKLVRTVEYPDGEMVSIVIRTNNLNRLKNEIIKHQPALFPGVELDQADVKYMARWTPPHFTEVCTKNKDLKMVPDGGVVFWSRFEPIPKRNVTLDIKDKDVIKLDQAISFVSRMGGKQGGVVEEAAKLSEPQENALIDMLLEKDDGVLALHRNFNQFPVLFKYHALRYLHAKGRLVVADQPQVQTQAQAAQTQTQVQAQTQPQTQQSQTQQQKTQQVIQKQQQQQQQQQSEQSKPVSPTQAPSPHELTNT
ncbi:hypothetical protein SAMD00019534_011070, partial [Acytostelium subglobosum LB1]|uniref:hypothetical protein n=1 Tax=Acytostelium subglobosum LB1 TaxID=1410327 RepID=UPI000644C412